jgi:hypothetical protein
VYRSQTKENDNNCASLSNDAQIIVT